VGDVAVIQTATIAAVAIALQIYRGIVPWFSSSSWIGA